MSEKLIAAARSFGTSFVAAFVASIPVTGFADLAWVEAAAVGALFAAVRTVLAALDPGQPLYGIGSGE